MANFNIDDTIPKNTEAVRFGAQRIREIKTILNATFGQIFNNDGPSYTFQTGWLPSASIANLAIVTVKIADLAVTTVKLAVGVLSKTAAGHALMEDGYLCSDAGTFAGALITGRTYRIDTLAGGDIFTNAGYVSPGVPFVALGTGIITPTTWTSTVVIDVVAASKGTHTAALISGRTYRIDTLQSGDDFSNVGYVSAGVPFTATGTTPATWANGTTVVDTVLEEGLAKLNDGLLTANAAGRAKMQDGFIQTAQLGYQSVTNPKLAPQAVTLDKMDPTAIAVLGWAQITGSGLRANRLLKSGTGSISATTSPTVTTHGLFSMSTGTHELGAIPTLVKDVVAVVINRNEDSSYLSGSGENRVYTPGPAFPSTTLISGQVYFARPVDAAGSLSTSHFTLHATPADAVNGVNAIDFGGDFTSGTPYIQYFRPSDAIVNGAAIFPLAIAGQQGEYQGAIIVWNSPPSDSHYLAVFTNNDPANTSAFRIMGQAANYVIIGPNGGTVGNGNWNTAYPSMRLVGLR